MLAVADARLFIDPLISSALANSFGGVTGLLAVALPMLAYAWLHEIKPDRLRAGHFGIGMLAIGSLLSCLGKPARSRRLGRVSYAGVGDERGAWLMFALRRFARLEEPVAQVGDQRALEKWVTGLALTIVAMILRGLSHGEPWWTVGFRFRPASCSPG